MLQNIVRAPSTGCECAGAGVLTLYARYERAFLLQKIILDGRIVMNGK